MAAFLSLTIGCAYGADISADAAPSYKDTPGNYWVVTLGGYGARRTEFPGAKKYGLQVRPIVDIHRPENREWLTLPADALSLTLYQTGNFRVGAAADFLLDRVQSDDRRA